MGEPKMPDYNSPEWQEEFARSSKNQEKLTKQEFRNSLIEFVKKLRNGTAGNYGYKNFVDGFFNPEKSVTMVSSKDGSIPFDENLEFMKLRNIGYSDLSCPVKERGFTTPRLPYSLILRSMLRNRIDVLVFKIKKSIQNK